MDVPQRKWRDYLRHQRRIRSVKEGGHEDDSKDEEENESFYSRVPPSPRACHDELVWKSNLHRKNREIRNMNSTFGWLGQYRVGDPDGYYRLDDKLKDVMN